MLKEINDLTQTSDDLQRRWFSDEEIDLYVWLDENDTIHEFQISYHTNDNDHVLIWNSASGLFAHSVDSGTLNPSKMKSSPMLTENIEFDVNHIRDLFEKNGKKLEHDLYEFILSRLKINSD